MVSQHERQRLTEAFKRETLTGAAIVLKCVAGLLVVAGLAVIEAQTDTSDATATAASQLRSQKHEKASIAHSKTLYQERQTRLASTQAGLPVEIPSANVADTGHPN
jgi:hypothetical protein